MKVLIIDDDPDALAIARVRLKPEELDIVSHSDATTAVEAVRRETPDLVLLDIDMPGRSGFVICNQLQGDQDLGRIPVIFLSGSTDTADKVKGLDYGAVDYITKPFDAFELRARVRAALRTKRLQDMLAEYAQIDPLTGVANRRGLERHLRTEWSRAQRQGSVLAFALGDIDHFKNVNDQYGHPVGDKVLQAVARAIAGECREMDLPARYGGEEFAVLVPDTTAEHAWALAERCRKNVESVGVSAENQSVGVTISFGVADSIGVETPEDLLAQADKALYGAKESGRNAVSLG
ncbi:MAG: diguanylate cyclase [Phycisphaerae bacterium]|nr:diguanylate cyclase [Phycisphaerae bacterium]